MNTLTTAYTCVSAHPALTVLALWVTTFAILATFRTTRRAIRKLSDNGTLIGLFFFSTLGGVWLAGLEDNLPGIYLIVLIIYASVILRAAALEKN